MSSEILMSDFAGPNMESNGSNSAYSSAAQTQAEEKRTKHIVSDFMQTTSAHGWGRAARTQSRPLKVLWIVLTLLALAVNIGHVTILALQYLKFPYEQVSRVEVEEIAFPSVTVCNIQPISLSSMEVMLKNASSKFSQWNNTTNFFFNQLANATNDTYKFRLLYDRLRGPRGFYENIGDEVDYLGHQPRDFILSSIFAQTPSSPQNFTRVKSSTYYNCYTFNGGNISAEKAIAQMTGPQAGLSMVLYLESDNGDFYYTGPYYTFLNVGNAAGVRVIIHPPDTWPSPMDHGFDIPPGYSSSVGLEVMRHERLGRPYSDCKSTLVSPDKRFVYSSHECLMECQQEHIVSQCGCFSAELPYNTSHTSTLQYCGYFNDSNPIDIFNRTVCESASRLEFLTNERLRQPCKCYSPCEEYEYKSDVSYSYWPVDFSQETFYNIYVANNPDRDELKAWHNLNSFNLSQLIFYGLVRKNFVRLNVYIKSLVIQEYLQQGSYTFFNLFSDIGGTFGLWIGMSLLTWGEVLELLVKICARWCRKVVFGIATLNTSTKIGDREPPEQIPRTDASLYT